MATEKSLHDAQAQITEQWSASVNRIWSLYENLFATPKERAAALRSTGITNTYSSIAAALLAASKRFPTKADITKYGIVAGIVGGGQDSGTAAYDAAQRAVANGSGEGIPYTTLSATEMKGIASRATYTAACEIYGRATNGNFGAPSALCPPFPDRDFFDQDYSASNISARTADYYQKLGATYMLTIADFFALLPQAESYVANALTTYSMLQKTAELLAAAQAANETELVTKASKAAAKAQAAATQASSWSGSTRARALLAAEQQYAIAREARAVLTYASTPGTPAASSASKKKMANAVAAANTALATAKSNSFHAQILTGGAVAAGVAALSYLLLRRRA